MAVVQDAQHRARTARMAGVAATLCSLMVTVPATSLALEQGMQGPFIDHFNGMLADFWETVDGDLTTECPLRNDDASTLLFTSDRNLPIVNGVSDATKHAVGLEARTRPLDLANGARLTYTLYFPVDAKGWHDCRADGMIQHTVFLQYSVDGVHWQTIQTHNTLAWHTKPLTDIREQYYFDMDLPWQAWTPWTQLRWWAPAQTGMADWLLGNVEIGTFPWFEQAPEQRLDDVLRALCGWGVEDADPMACPVEAVCPGGPGAISVDGGVRACGQTLEEPCPEGIDPAQACGVAPPPDADADGVPDALEEPICLLRGEGGGETFEILGTCSGADYMPPEVSP